MGDAVRRVTVAVELGTRLSGLAAVGDAVWVAVEGRNEVAQINTATNRVDAVVSLPGPPVWLVASEDALWVSSARASVVWRVDLASLEIVAELPMAAVPLDMVYVAGHVWVPNRSDGLVTRIDPATDATTEIEVTGGIYVLEQVGERIWVLDFDDAEAYVIDPALVDP